MTKPVSNTAATVRALAEPIAASLGYVLWDVEYVKEGARRILRLTIDTPADAEEGITIDDCEKMHRAIDPVLDEADPIEEAYYLEVSSPGLERELRTPEHVAFCIGWEVEVRLFAPIEGAKVYVGELGGYDEEGRLCLTVGQTEMTFPKNAVAKMTTVFHFDD